MSKATDIIQKWGESLSVTTEGAELNFKGIIQPLNKKRYSTYFTERLSAGTLCNNVYYLIFPPTVSLAAGTVIRSEDKSYCVRSCGAFKVKNESVYAWAVLSARAVSEEDDYEQY